MITVTQAAADKMFMMILNTPSASCVTVGVKGGGCSGMSYSIQPHRFDGHTKAKYVMAKTVSGKEFLVLIDPKSEPYLKGMTLDYQKTLMLEGFVFTNPNTAKACGCGTSFSPK